jgi:hypothetical protein
MSKVESNFELKDCRGFEVERLNDRPLPICPSDTDPCTKLPATLLGLIQRAVAGRCGMEYDTSFVQLDRKSEPDKMAEDAQERLVKRSQESSE